MMSDLQHYRMWSWRQRERKSGRTLEELTPWGLRRAEMILRGAHCQPPCHLCRETETAISIASLCVRPW
jgi:hypothetical protein